MLIVVACRKTGAINIYQKYFYSHHYNFEQIKSVKGQNNFNPKNIKLEINFLELMVFLPKQ